MAIVFLLPLLDRVKPLTYAAAIAIFALWPWSGIIARALPIVRNYEPAHGDVRRSASALAPSEAWTIGVPPHVRHVVVTASGGQMARLKHGRVVGTIEATDARGRITTRPITIGDVADFGFTPPRAVLRLAQSAAAILDGRDPRLRRERLGVGRAAARRSPRRRTSPTLRVIAAPNLPHDAHLQIDSVEFPPR